jgi:hypothetical protein
MAECKDAGRTHLQRAVALGIVTIGCLFLPPRLEAQTLTLDIASGRVTLIARDVSVRDILRTWASQAGTHIVNLDAASTHRVSLQLVGVSERHALSVLLSDVDGYILGSGIDATGLPRIERILIVRSQPVALTAAPVTALTSSGSADVPPAYTSALGDAPVAQVGLERAATADSTIEIETAGNRPQGTPLASDDSRRAATSREQTTSREQAGPDPDGMEGYRKANQEWMRRQEAERAATPFGAGTGSARPGEVNPAPHAPFAPPPTSTPQSK